MSSTTLFPPLPTEIKQSLAKPVALTTKDITHQLRTHGRGLSPADHADVLDKHQDYLDGLNSDQQAILKYLKQLAQTPAPSTSGGAASSVADFLLVAGATTTISPTAPVHIGDLLYAFVQAHGPTAALAWGTGIKWAPTEFDSTTNTWTVFSFVGRTDPADSILKWYYVGPETVTGKVT